MSNKNEVFEYLIDPLRQQVNNNQCEDLAHEVLSLKNQLRDASALVAELQKTIKLMNEDFKRTTANPEYREELSQFYKDLMYVSERSGCRKDDTQECEHDWLHSKHKTGFVCFNCGARKEDTQGRGTGVAGRVRKGGVKVTGGQSECPHLWHYYDDHLVHCVLCGLKRSDEEL